MSLQFQGFSPVTIVGENESGKSNALEGLTKINLQNDLLPNETTYFTEEYRKKICPTLRFEFRCTDKEFTELQTIYIKNPRRITIERSQSSDKNDFLLLKPEITTTEIAQDNFENIHSKCKILLNEYKSFISSDDSEEENASEDVENDEKLFESEYQESFSNLFTINLNQISTVEEIEKIIEEFNDGIPINYLKDTIKENLEKNINSNSTILTKDLIPDDILSKNKFKTYKNHLRSIFPEIILFKINATFSDNISIEQLFNETDKSEINSFKNLLNKIGQINISKEDYLLASKAGKESSDIGHRIDSILNTASTGITKKIAEVWKTNESEKITFKLKYGDKKISLKLEDETLGIYNPSDRSTGFQWYLRFYVDLLTLMVDKSRNKVILIEEPGVYLHPEAQIDLLNRVFLDLIPDDHQIVYTTHSPFLISNERINRSVRVAQKHKGEKGASFIGVGGGVSSSPIKLLRQKFKYNILDDEITNKPVLIVEGADDKDILISLFKKATTDKTYNKIAIVPSGGASEIHKIAKIVSAFAEKIFVLVDNDEAGVDAISDLEKYKLKLIKTYKITNIKTKSKTIEDIIPEEIYIEALNDCYDSYQYRNTTFKPIQLSDLPLKGKIAFRKNFKDKQNLIGILDKVRNYFSENGIIDFDSFDDFKKDEINGIAARLIEEHVTKGSISFIKEFFDEIISLSKK